MTYPGLVYMAKLRVISIDPESIATTVFNYCISVLPSLILGFCEHKIFTLYLIQSVKESCMDFTLPQGISFTFMKIYLSKFHSPAHI